MSRNFIPMAKKDGERWRACILMAHGDCEGELIDVSTEIEEDFPTEELAQLCADGWTDQLPDLIKRTWLHRRSKLS